MKRAWLVGLAVAWAVMSAGCNRSADPAEYAAAFREQLEAQKELIDLLVTVQDAASMKSARPELSKLFGRFERIRARIKALPAPSNDIKDQLQDELGNEVRQTMGELLEQAQRIEKLPGGKDFIARLKLQR